MKSSFLGWGWIWDWRGAEWGLGMTVLGPRGATPWLAWNPDLVVPLILVLLYLLSQAEKRDSGRGLGKLVITGARYILKLC